MKRVPKRPHEHGQRRFINLLNCISLLGSVLLLGAAFLLFFRPSFAAKIGLAGSVLSWVYYGPLIVAGLVTPFSMGLEMKSLITFHEYVPLVGMVFGPVLLIACTGPLDTALQAFVGGRERLFGPPVNRGEIGR